MKKNMIFALGFFDGVHLGHQALLAECVRLAEQMDAQTAAITFENHPQSLFRADVPPLLTTLADRVRLLGRYGMEEVIAYPVTEAVMGMHWACTGRIFSGSFWTGEPWALSAAMISGSAAGERATPRS